MLIVNVLLLTSNPPRSIDSELVWLHPPPKLGHATSHGTQKRHERVLQQLVGLLPKKKKSFRATEIGQSSYESRLRMFWCSLAEKPRKTAPTPLCTSLQDCSKELVPKPTSGSLSAIIAFWICQVALYQSSLCLCGVLQF